MKAVQIVKPNDLRIVDMEKPGIDQEKNVLIKMTASGICGSDVGIYHGTNAAATYPRVIGHEIVGVVDEIGEGVTKVKVGDFQHERYLRSQRDQAAEKSASSPSRP